MSNERMAFYVVVGSEIRGPYAREKILEFARNGKLSKQSRVSMDLKTWIDLGSVAGVKFPPPKPKEKPKEVAKEPTVDSVLNKPQEAISTSTSDQLPIDGIVGDSPLLGSYWQASELPSAPAITPTAIAKKTEKARRRRWSWLFDLKYAIIPRILQWSWTISLILSAIWWLVFSCFYPLMALEMVAQGKMDSMMAIVLSILFPIGMALIVAIELVAIRLVLEALVAVFQGVEYLKKIAEGME